MKQEHKYCRTCLTELGQDNYCEKCTYYYGNKPDEILYKEDFPTEYYWYGLIAALVFGFVSYLIIYVLFGGDAMMKKMGVALFFIVPLCSGATLGYFIPPIKYLIPRVFIASVVAICLATLIYEAKLSGLACATILAAIFLLWINFWTGL